MHSLIAMQRQAKTSPTSSRFCEILQQGIDMGMGAEVMVSTYAFFKNSCD